MGEDEGRPGEVKEKKIEGGGIGGKGRDEEK